MSTWGEGSDRVWGNGREGGFADLGGLLRIQAVS